MWINIKNIVDIDILTVDKFISGINTTFFKNHLTKMPINTIMIRPNFLRKEDAQNEDDISAKEKISCKGSWL